MFRVSTKNGDRLQQWFKNKLNYDNNKNKQVAFDVYGWDGKPETYPPCFFMEEHLSVFWVGKLNP